MWILHWTSTVVSSFCFAKLWHCSKSGDDQQQPQATGVQITDTESRSHHTGKRPGQSGQQHLDFLCQMKRAHLIGIPLSHIAGHCARVLPDHTNKIIHDPFHPHLAGYWKKDLQHPQQNSHNMQQLLKYSKSKILKDFLCQHDACLNERIAKTLSNFDVYFFLFN